MGTESHLCPDDMILQELLGGTQVKHKETGASQASENKPNDLYAASRASFWLADARQD